MFLKLFGQTDSRKQHEQTVWIQTKNQPGQRPSVWCYGTFFLCLVSFVSMTNLLEDIPVVLSTMSISTQTLVSLRRRFMRCTLFSMAVGSVISVAQLAGNQPLSPSLILSP